MLRKTKLGYSQQIIELYDGYQIYNDEKRLLLQDFRIFPILLFSIPLPSCYLVHDAHHLCLENMLPVINQCTIQCFCGEMEYLRNQKFWREMVSKRKNPLSSCGLFPIMILSLLLVIYCFIIINGTINLYINRAFYTIAFTMLFLMGILFPLKIHINGISRYIMSSVTYMVSSALIMFISFSFFSPATIFSSGVVHSYSNICIAFRINGTYKVHYSNVSTGDTYKICHIHQK